MDNYTGFLGREMQDHGLGLADSRIGHYKNLLRSGRLIEGFRFLRLERREGLYGVDGDCDIFLPVTEMFERKTERGSFVAFSNLDREYNLKVIAVDEEKKLVTVSFIQAQLVFRDKAIENLDAELAAGRIPVAKATVDGIIRDNGGRELGLIVSIFGLGIRGRMSIRDWSDLYVPDLYSIVKPQDVIVVGVTGKTTHSGVPMYTVSRRAIEKDEAESLLKRLGDGSSVTAKCVALREKGFVSEVNGIKNVHVFTYFPKFLNIVRGKNYAARVIKGPNGQLRLRVIKGTS